MHMYYICIHSFQVTIYMFEVQCHSKYHSASHVHTCEALHWMIYDIELLNMCAHTCSALFYWLMICLIQCLTCAHMCWALNSLIQFNSLISLALCCICLRWNFNIFNIYHSAEHVHTCEALHWMIYDIDWYWLNHHQYLWLYSSIKLSFIASHVCTHMWSIVLIESSLISLALCCISLLRFNVYINFNSNS